MSVLSSFYPLPIIAGTTDGTYAAGDDSRIVGAAQKLEDEDIEITNNTRGLILKDSNNIRRRIRVDVDGTLLTEVLP